MHAAIKTSYHMIGKFRGSKVLLLSLFSIFRQFHAVFFCGGVSRPTNYIGVVEVKFRYFNPNTKLKKNLNTLELYQLHSKCAMRLVWLCGTVLYNEIKEGVPNNANTCSIMLYFVISDREQHAMVT